MENPQETPLARRPRTEAFFHESNLSQLLSPKASSRHLVALAARRSSTLNSPIIRRSLAPKAAVYRRLLDNSMCVSVCVCVCVCVCVFFLVLQRHMQTQKQFSKRFQKPTGKQKPRQQPCRLPCPSLQLRKTRNLLFVICKVLRFPFDVPNSPCLAAFSVPLPARKHHWAHLSQQQEVPRPCLRVLVVAVGVSGWKFGEVAETLLLELLLYKFFGEQTGGAGTCKCRCVAGWAPRDVKARLKSVLEFYNSVNLDSVCVVLNMLTRRLADPAKAALHCTSCAWLNLKPKPLNPVVGGSACRKELCPRCALSHARDRSSCPSSLKKG